MAAVTTEERFRCWNAHISAAGITSEHEIVRGTDPRYLAAPGNFVPESVPLAELPHPQDLAFARLTPEAVAAEAAAEAERNQVLVAPPDLVRAKRDVAGAHERKHSTILKGSVIPADHPVAVDQPGAFERVTVR